MRPFAQRPITTIPLLADTIEAILAPALTAPCRIDINRQADTTFISLTPSTADISKLIGRGGANFRSLKTIVEYLAEDGHTFRFVVADPTPGTKTPPVPRNALWTPERVVEAVQAYLAAIEEPTGVHAQPKDDGYLLILAAKMPEDVWAALSKWISVCALSLGGYASLELYEIATA